MSPYLLLAIGLLLIFIEFYIPGAVMGIIGGIFILASLVVFAAASDSPLEIVLYTIGIFISLAVLIKFALWRIRHTRPERSIYSNGSQVGYQASKFDPHVIGKEGVVLSDLKPGGYILIAGKQHQAISQSGYVTKGSKVLVVSGQEESLIVKKLGEKL